MRALRHPRHLLLAALVPLVMTCGLSGCRAPSAGGAPAGTPAGAATRPPNVLLIMADDMGYSDVGAFGGEIRTPALDALAEHGLLFTNFYTNNMCVPTRASALTGTYHLRAYDREARALSDRVVTMAEVLGDAGYATWMSGKWHLGPWNEEGGVQDTTSWPLQRGFDRFFGTILGANSYFAPNSLTRGNAPAEGEYRREDFYYTDAIGTEAVRFVEEAAARQTPFFGYVAFTAPHWPLHALPEDIRRYEGRYDAGWDSLRAERYRRMQQLGLLNPGTHLTARHPEVPAWEGLTDEERRWHARRMEVYAAQIDRMDQNIARLVDALRRTGTLDDTLIFFLADNGGCHVELPPSRTGAFLPERTREGAPVRNGNLLDIMPGPEDTYQSYGYGWANASNTPYRLFKQFDHEGGIRTPLIVHWPAGIARPGRHVREVGHNMDLMATVLDVTGAAHPSTYDGRRIHPIDGRSLAPLLQGRPHEGHERLFWSWARGRAAREGRWKVVAADDGPWALYDLEADPVESTDLASVHPDTVEALVGAWEAWAARSGEHAP